MEKNGCGQGAPIMKRGKKKQAKDEIDRQKQAEKKKRRLEKALATSAAIRSELEKKKQKKIEEQLRLDQEGAAIAESVALHVLLGEDKDELCPIMLSKSRRYTSWDNSRDIGIFKGYQHSGKYSSGGMGWATGDYETSCKWNDWGIGHTLPLGVHVRNFQTPYYEETSQGADLSVGLIAAQAVSSLHIAENSGEDLFTRQGARAVVFNKMLGNSSLGNEIKFYNEF